MAALQDEWQAGREARQRERVQRQQEVQASLEANRLARQAEAAKTRQVLAESREALQAETSLYLAQVKQQRLAEAARTDALLKNFRAALRAANQQEMVKISDAVAALQKVTHEALAGHRRDRAVMADRQQQQLTEYVSELRASVAEYLMETADNRKMIAVQEQAKRHRDREELTRQVEALRDEFKVHKAEMVAFREDLRRSVWGNAAPVAQVAPPPPLKRSVSNERTPTRGQTAAPTVASPLPPSPPATVHTAVATEEAIFNYLQTHPEGARLTEIESSLGINRFQAVDALKSLIQKSIIVRQDRTYRILEEAVL